LSAVAGDIAYAIELILAFAACSLPGWFILLVLTTKLLRRKALRFPSNHSIPTA
jgi:hypothetical protein